MRECARCQCCSGSSLRRVGCRSSSVGCCISGCVGVSEGPSARRSLVCPAEPGGSLGASGAKSQSQSASHGTALGAERTVNAIVGSLAHFPAMLQCYSAKTEL